MDIQFQCSATETSRMDTEQLREAFLVQQLMQPGQIKLLYTHYDRMIIGGVVPQSVPIALPNEAELKATHFLERREMGIINVGGSGTITANGTTFESGKLDGVYLGKGTTDVQFSSSNAGDPACFYLLSVPAHQTHPNKKITRQEVTALQLGETAHANKRTLCKYIHKDGIQSCQLVMGVTVLEEGSVWNSVPPHTHTRRMEAYFYFDVPENQRVMHFMGAPQQTRHLVIQNREAVVSPPWSVHFGCGTAHYGFIWGMAGENMEFTDMDAVPVATLQ